MTTNHASDASATSTDNLGEQIGLLKSTSETKQVAIIVVSLLSWGFIWQLQMIGSFVLIFGCLATMIGLYLLSLNFGDSLHIFKQGLELRQNGKTVVFAFDEVTSFSAKHTHHCLRHTYVATKSQLTFQLEDGLAVFGFECDYRRNDSKEQLIQLVLEQCSGAVQLRLLAKLTADGEVLWTDNVYLAQGGLKIVDTVAAPRIIPFADIEELQMKDNQLKIWKSGDAMPFMVLPNDTSNFVPLLGLFRKLTAFSHEINGSEAAEPMDNFAVATTNQPFD